MYSNSNWKTCITKKERILFLIFTLWFHGIKISYLIFFFRSHTDGVTCLQFNDFYIVSGSYDKTVKLWDFTVCWYIVIFSWKWFHGNFFYTYTNYSNRSWYNNDNIVLYTLNLGCSWLLFRIPTLHNQHFWNFFRVYLLLIWVFGDQNANLKMKWSRFLCSRKFKQRPRSKWKNKIKEVFCHLEININIVLDPAYNLSRLLARIAQTKKKIIDFCLWNILRRCLCNLKMTRMKSHN